MSNLEDPVVEDGVIPETDLSKRSRLLIKQFEGEEKSYAFHDGGEACMYAEWFVDLLKEWIACS